MLKDFKAFLMQGNLIEIAVAFVLGGAFGVVVTSLVSDLIMPIIAAIFGKPSFDSLTFTINDSVFSYGKFITALLTFVIIAAAIYIFVVKPVQMVTEKAKKTEEEAGPTNEERMVELLEKIAAK